MTKNQIHLISDTFKNRKVLLTGHTGFKGSWLSIWLTLLGAEVVGYALDPYTENDNFVRCELSNKMVDVRGDVRDYHFLKNVFDEHQPEFVFHLAAQPLVRESYTHPKDTLDVNIGGTVNVFECCRESDSVKVIINVTSDKCYENKGVEQGYREDDPMGGYDPYSASKGCSELVTASYRRSFFNPDQFEKHGKGISSVRAGNVIGGGDWAKDRIIPDCIRALVKNEKILIRNPSASRPWQLVLEPLGGYLLLGAMMCEEPQKFFGAWNFGPENESVIPVQSIVEMVIDKWGSGEWYTESTADDPYEAKLLALDINKAKTHLKWEPKYNAERAIEETMRWYKVNLDGKDMHGLCVEQIEKYMNDRVVS